MNRIPTIFSGANLQSGEIDTTYTLHHLLRTLEDMYDLDHSGAAAKVNAIRGVFTGEERLSTTSVRFQQGVDGYFGVQDVELRQYEPDVDLESEPIITVDRDNSDLAGNQLSQALIRFDDLVGWGVGQVPPGARIDSAQLILTTGSTANADPSPDTMELHRMLTPWNENSTWNNLKDGVSVDDIEAVREADFLLQPNAVGAPAIWATTPTVQSWVDGQPNEGWVITADGADGWGWNSAEALRSNVRPKLEVVYFSPVVPGDFNGDGRVDVEDIDALSEVVRNGTNEVAFDVDRDGLVNGHDRELWVHQIKQTWFGDTNLDGQFDTGDLVGVFQLNEYEDEELDNSTWADGDWNGDGDFTSGDLVVAFQDGGFEGGIHRIGLVAVPEPSSLILLLIAVLALPRVARRT